MFHYNHHRQMLINGVKKNYQTVKREYLLLFQGVPFGDSHTNVQVITIMIRRKVC